MYVWMLSGSPGSSQRLRQLHIARVEPTADAVHHLAHRRQIFAGELHRCPHQQASSARG